VAGKTILLDALGLAAGGRGQGRASVRPGAPGIGNCIFEPPMDQWSTDATVEHAIAQSDEIVLRRTLSTDGRTKGIRDDESTGVGLLKAWERTLLEVHGQTDDRGLFDVGNPSPPRSTLSLP